MTSIPERIIAFFAPHWCMVCGIEDNTLCEACVASVFTQPDSACVMCARPTADWRLCAPCTKKSSLQHVWVATEYKDTVAKLLKRYKFERMKAAVEPLALALDDILPYFDSNVVVVPLPTISPHVRQRGYDHALLLARELVRLRSLTVATPLLRRHNLRQVGTGRQERLTQAKTAYTLAAGHNVKGKHILLIDDICTTGASLAAAAKLLHRAGAIEVKAAVVAWQRPEK